MSNEVRKLKKQLKDAKEDAEYYEKEYRRVDDKWDFQIGVTIILSAVLIIGFLLFIGSWALGGIDIGLSDRPDWYTTTSCDNCMNDYRCVEGISFSSVSCIKKDTGWHSSRNSWYTEELNCVENTTREFIAEDCDDIYQAYIHEGKDYLYIEHYNKTCNYPSYDVSKSKPGGDLYDALVKGCLK